MNKIIVDENIIVEEQLEQEVELMREEQLHDPQEGLPLIPLRGMVLFPQMEVHLDVGRSGSLEAVNYALDHELNLLLVTQKDNTKEKPTKEDLYRFGVLAEVKQVITLPTEGMRILVKAKSAVRVTGYLSEKPIFLADYAKIDLDMYCDSDELEVLLRSVMNGFEGYVRRSGKVTPDNLRRIKETADLAVRVDLICAHLTLIIDDRMKLLQASSLQEKLELILVFLLREEQLSALEKKITDQVKVQIDKGQKEYYLREKIKVISEELGEGEDRAAEIHDFKERVEAAKLPPDVAEKALKEINRLAKIAAMSPEYSVIRNYLDWILDLPWGVYTEDQLDILKAEGILNDDHYGLVKVKERILEFLAVRQLKTDTKGSIICLVGPPGVGKTSLAKSIARALEKRFVRLSLGGVRDEAEIRGHRRTYIGALPGRVIRGLCDAKSANPVFLFDEIDKMTNDFRGDPASALLEVLDPEQNNTFSDHFIEVAFDLSKVLFITTANSVHTIPDALLDRMEIIELSSYTEEEKLQIALRYLVPKQIAEHGLTEDQVHISANTLMAIIRYHTREAGVRNLERKIGAICRKGAKEIVSGKKALIRITKQNLPTYLGAPRYHYGVREQSDEVGVVTGMAWTSVGGEILPIEVNTLKGKGSLQLTGQLGDVMKESAQLGLSYVRSISEELKLADNFYETMDIHIHVPEGATPKDGPSAGVAMATAMVSALTGRKVHKEIAMTGEMTLRGKVLAVGGIKEKVLAAHRAGSRVIVMPHENKKDLEEIPMTIQKDLTFHFVAHITEVLALALVEE